MKNLYSHKISLRAVFILSLFLILAALVFADMAKSLSVFQSSNTFTVVLDPGHGGYPLRTTAHKKQASHV